MVVPLTLAVATDALLKNEFDYVRSNQSSHPVWDRYQLNLRAFDHKEIDLWRNNFKGLRVHWPDIDTEIFGAVDDIWANLDTGQLHVVDYKSTSKQGEPTIDGGFGDGYKRQMEFYQWLLQNKGFEVSSIGYFLYVNGRKDRNFYDNCLVGIMEFDTYLIPHTGNSDWVEPTIKAALECLNSNDVPETTAGCDNCRYFSDRLKLTLPH